MEGQFAPASGEDGTVPAARVPLFLRVGFKSRVHKQHSVLIKLASETCGGDRIDVSTDAGRGLISAIDVLKSLIITEEVRYTPKWAGALYTRIEPSVIRVSRFCNKGLLLQVSFDAGETPRFLGWAKFPFCIQYNKEVQWYVSRSFDNDSAGEDVSDEVLNTYFEQFGVIGLSVDDEGCYSVAARVEDAPSLSGTARDRRRGARAAETTGKKSTPRKRGPRAASLPPVPADEEEEMEGRNPEDLSEEEAPSPPPPPSRKKDEVVKKGGNAKRKGDDRDAIIEQQRLQIEKLRGELKEECQRKSRYFQAKNGLSRQLKAIQSKRKENEQYVVTEAFRRNYLQMMVFFANILQRENDFVGFIRDHVEGSKGDGSKSFLQVFTKGRGNDGITTLEEFRKQWNEIGERVFKDVRGAEEFISKLKEHIEACPDDGNGTLLKLIQLYRPERSNGYYKFLYSWSLLGNLAFGNVETDTQLRTSVDQIRSRVREILMGKRFEPAQLLTKWEFDLFKAGQLTFPSAPQRAAADEPPVAVSHGGSIFRNLGKFDYRVMSNEAMVAHLECQLDTEEIEGQDEPQEGSPSVPDGLDYAAITDICNEAGLDLTCFVSLDSYIPPFFARQGTAAGPLGDGGMA